MLSRSKCVEILREQCVICIPSIPWSSTETWSLWTCCWTSQSQASERWSKAMSCNSKQQQPPNKIRNLISIWKVYANFFHLFQITGILNWFLRVFLFVDVKRLLGCAVDQSLRLWCCQVPSPSRDLGTDDQPGRSVDPSVKSILILEKYAKKE